MGEERKRPSVAGQGERGKQKAAMRPRNTHFSRRASRAAQWRSPWALSRGMTALQMMQVFIACTLAVLAAKGLLDLYAWCVGHFVKGWW